MSALTPHIRALRALGQAMGEEGIIAAEKARAMKDRPHQQGGLNSYIVALTLTHQANAFIHAADQLEAEEQAAQEKLTG